MKLKQKIFLLLLALGVLSASVILPQYILSSVPSAQAVLPVQATYTPYISCSGFLQANDLKEVYALYPVMVEEVYVQPGDWVNEGDILAQIDVATTKAIANNQSNAEADQQTIEQYRELAKQYGVEDKLEEYLVQQTLSVKGDTFLPVEEQIIAQHTGKVMSVNAVSGCLTQAGDPLYSINSSNESTLVLQVEEEDVDLIKIGDRVIFYLPEQEKTPFYAKVCQIAPVVTQENGLLQTNTYVEVWAQVTSNYENLRPGSTVEAKIATNNTGLLTAVPYSAISQDEQNREFIYQLENGRPVMKYIEVEKEESRYVYVSSGIDKGRPVLLNAESLDPTCRFKIEYQGENDV